MKRQRTPTATEQTKTIILKPTYFHLKINFKMNSNRPFHEQKYIQNKIIKLLSSWITFYKQKTNSVYLLKTKCRFICLRLDAHHPLNSSVLRVATRLSRSFLESTIYFLFTYKNDTKYLLNGGFTNRPVYLHSNGRGTLGARKFYWFN